MGKSAHRFTHKKNKFIKLNFELFSYICAYEKSSGSHIEL